jgi:hypothetical protein
MARDTGFVTADAQNDFVRARRAAALGRLGQRLRRHPSDVNLILPFEEVIEALGRIDEHDIGLRVITLDSIVGTVDRTREFDREFRPTSARVRRRWERIAAAQRRGESMPPISVFRIGELHFVRDGHHRVSVARALRREDIEAYVTEVGTRVGLNRAVRLADLPIKGHERLFHERVPLSPEAARHIDLHDAWEWGNLAENVEAWGFRVMQERGEFMDRPTVAREWYEDEYVPVVAMLREADLIADGSETEAYVRVAAMRYRLMRTHRWSEDIVSHLASKLR